MQRAVLHQVTSPDHKSIGPTKFTDGLLLHNSMICSPSIAVFFSQKPLTHFSQKQRVVFMLN